MRGLIQASPENNAADMKIEVSIPDPIFAAVEQLADKLGVSLNEVYTRAVTDWLARNQNREQKQAPECEWEHLSGEEITARLNEYYEHNPSQLDPVIQQLQALAIGTEEW